MESDISGRNKEMWITILLAVLLCLSIGYSIYQKRKTYRLIDRLLDSVLNREMIAASDVEEGEYSALVSKIKQIQEVLDNHVNSAEQEKEQVYWLMYSLWQSKAFYPFLRGSVIPFVVLRDVKSCLSAALNKVDENPAQFEKAVAALRSLEAIEKQYKQNLLLISQTKRMLF